MTTLTPAIGWSNSYSVAFIDLLSVCAAAKAVDPSQSRFWTYSVGNLSGRATSGLERGLVFLPYRAANLMSRELVARLNTGQALISASWDPLLELGGCRTGQGWADGYLCAAQEPYRLMSGGVVRIAETVLRHGVPNPPSYVQAATVAAYRVELAAVLAEWRFVMTDLAELARINVAANPIRAAAIADEIAAARARYVELLQAAYPDRGYA